MSVSPTREKNSKTINSRNRLEQTCEPSIKFVSEVIGVEYGQPHYRSLETDKIQALKITRPL